MSEQNVIATALRLINKDPYLFFRRLSRACSVQIGDNSIPIVPMKSVDELVLIYENCRKELKVYWLENPNLNMAQILSHFGIFTIPFGFLYHANIRDFMTCLRMCKIGDISYWTSIYKRGKIKRPKEVTRVIKAYTSEHLMLILRTQKNLQYGMYIILIDELFSRNAIKTSDLEYILKQTKRTSYAYGIREYLRYLYRLRIVV